MVVARWAGHEKNSFFWACPVSAESLFGGRPLFFEVDFSCRELSLLKLGVDSRVELAFTASSIVWRDKQRSICSLNALSFAG